MKEAEKVIELVGVGASYGGVTVLEDITLSVAATDFLAVIGPNGSGKTTLIKVVLGLVRPDRGEVRLLGLPPREGRTGVGYLPQQPPLDLAFPISVFDVVLMGRYRGMFRRYTPEDRAAAARALDTVGMEGFSGRQIGQLSMGQLQRVLIARAIAGEPRLLILDEPAASIDPGMQRSLYDLLEDLRKRMAIVMVTHDTGVVTDLVDQVACINRRLFYHGSSEVGLEALEAAYHCPIDLVAHGAPHRVLREHDEGDGR
ncbi:MAG: metal ABC transporter ATP-binding protein [Thermodesulfobacteriota bacterium]